MRSILKLIKTSGPIILLVAAAGCATPATDQVATTDLDLNEMVCRKDSSTGSRLSTRTCKTRGEWQQEAAESKALGRNMQRDTAAPQDAPTAGGG